MRIRFTTPFAVFAAPAEAGHDMGVGTADTVTAYTEGFDLFVLMPLPHKFVVITSSDGTRINVDPWPSGGRRLFP